MKMRKSYCLVLFLLIVAVCVGITEAARNAGIFYSTLYAKTMEPERISGFGGDATAWFLKDVNGDNQDDAVIYYGTGDSLGQWRVALSNGSNFTTGSLWLDDASATTGMKPLMGDVNGDGMQDAVLFDPLDGRWYVSFSNGAGFNASLLFSSGNGVGSTNQFLADMDGDGDDDAVIAWRNWDGGKWYVGKSNGTTIFDTFTVWITGFGSGSDQRLMGDVNGDGKDDAILYIKSSGTWNVALSTGSVLTGNGTWRTGFGTNAEIGFVYDIDGDSNADIIYQKSGEWWVNYSNGSLFGTYNHRWITDLGQVTGGKQNPPPVVSFLLGSISVNSGWACIVDDWGRWFALNNTQKNQTFQLTVNNTYAAWRCSYEPQLSGYEGTYDSGDSVINDQQIEMMHDAGFTYVMLDITNGGHTWVDSRAKALMDRIRYWNNNLTAGRHKMYACIALGSTRGIVDEDPFFVKLNEECQRAWNEFITPYSDVYYNLNGKPLVIHMLHPYILASDYYNYIDTWSGGDRTYIDKITCRWMDVHQANSYGWIVPQDNLYHSEMMPVMPGFWNGSTYIDRENGNYYRNHWKRVLEYQPESVWVESMNESWEHNSIEPSYMFNTRQPHAGITMWTDSYGDRMDDYYWQMTVQYMKLYMEGALYEGTYLQEYISTNNYGPIYKAHPDGFIKQNQHPHQAPILLMPAGFLSSFAGTIIPKRDLSNPLAWWKLDEGTGNTVTDIESGFIGTLKNMNETAWNDHFLAGCLSFDGIDDSLELPAVLGEHFTISFWMKTSDSGYTGGQWWNGKGLVDAEVAGTANDFGISLMDGQVAFGVGNPDTTVRSIANVNDNLWHHVAVTRNASTGQIEVYIDGNLEKTGTGPAGNRMTAPLIRVGAIQTQAAFQFYQGIIDDLRFFSTVLDSTRIARLADSCAVVQESYGTLAGDWSGSSDIPDCTVDFSDFLFLSSHWLTSDNEVNYEAEAAEQIIGPVVRTNVAGYSGAGYLAFLVSPSGESVSWTVLIGSDADCNLIFRYINGGMTTRPMELYIDDVFVTTVSFAPTGSWSNWSQDTISEWLTSGTHSIKLVTTGSYGPYLDRMTIVCDSQAFSMDQLLQMAQNWLTCYDPVSSVCVWPF